jgi:hypothetical protein
MFRAFHKHSLYDGLTAYRIFFGTANAADKVIRRRTVIIPSFRQHLLMLTYGSPHE